MKYATPDGQSRRNAMVAGQLRVSKVNDARVLTAIAAVPREDFLPKSKAALAYLDEDIDIGNGRALIQPLVFARLLDAADIASTAHVLDIGCGSGYSTAVLVRLAASVVAVECDAGLAEQARQALAGSAKMVVGPLTAGSPENGPYETIILNGAVTNIPETLISQLKIGGTMVGVKIDAGVGRAFVGRKTATGFGTEAFMDAMVRILPGFAATTSFTF